jgi:hypothetical protein
MTLILGLKRSLGFVRMPECLSQIPKYQQTVGHRLVIVRMLLNHFNIIRSPFVTFYALYSFVFKQTGIPFKPERHNKEHRSQYWLLPAQRVEYSQRNIQFREPQRPLMLRQWRSEAEQHKGIKYILLLCRQVGLRHSVFDDTSD